MKVYYIIYSESKKVYDGKIISKPAPFWLSMFPLIHGKQGTLSLPHRQGDPFALRVDFHNGDSDFLMNFDNLVRVFDVAVSKFADVNKPVLMDADIRKGPNNASNCCKNMHPAKYPLIQHVEKIPKPSLNQQNTDYVKKFLKKYLIK